MQHHSRYGVRINTPTDTGAETFGSLVALLAPLVQMSPDQLGARLQLGPLTVASEVVEAEAWQLAALFERLGAEAEVVKQTRHEAKDDTIRFTPQELRAALSSNFSEVRASATIPLEAELSCFATRDTLAASTLALDEVSDNIRATVGFERPPGRRATPDPLTATLAFGAPAVQLSALLPPPIAKRPSTGALPFSDTPPLDAPIASGPSTSDPFESVDFSPTAAQAAVRDFALDTWREPAQRTPPPDETGMMGSVDLGPQVYEIGARPPTPSATGTVPRRIKISELGAPLSASASQPKAGIYAMPKAGTGRLIDEILSDTAPVSPRIIAVDSPVPLPKRDTPTRRGAVERSQGTPERRRPFRTPEPTRRPRPALAALLSLLLPGMGQVYNGQRERGVWFALGAVCVLPWIYAVFDAWYVARRSGPQRAPNSAAFRGQLGLNAVIFAGVIVGAIMWSRLQRVRQAPTTAPIAAMTDAEVEAEAEEAEEADTRVIVERPIEAVLADARVACKDGAYISCEVLAQDLIRRDPGLKEAYRLLVEATTKQSQGNK